MSSVNKEKNAMICKPKCNLIQFKDKMSSVQPDRLDYFITLIHPEFSTCNSSRGMFTVLLHHLRGHKLLEFEEGNLDHPCLINHD